MGWTLEIFTWWSVVGKTEGLITKDVKQNMLGLVCCLSEKWCGLESDPSWIVEIATSWGCAGDS